MEKEYKITDVQPRDPWTGKFGTFNSYAIQLEGEDGWVELSQVQKNKDGTDKPAPNVGDVINGSITITTRNERTYKKFKKSVPKQGGMQGGIFKEDINYMIMMLEELTLRRESPETPTPRNDVLPNDEDVEKPFDLSQIPF